MSVGMSGWGFSGWDPYASRWEQKNQQQAAQEQMDFQERMSSTAHQRQVADLQAAGLNPMLSAVAGAGGLHGSSTPPGAMANPRAVGGTGGNVQLQTAAQTAVLNAEAEKIGAETEEIRARTPTHGVQIERMRQEISESIERIGKIQQDVQVGVSSAAHLNQQVENLKAQLPQISASTNQLRTLANLNDAQAVQAIAASGLSEAHATEILQRVRENLPQIERELHRLDATIKQMSLPGHMANEAAQSSLAGQIGAYLRALVPLQGIMGAIPVGRGLRGKAGQDAPRIEVPGTRGGQIIVPQHRP